MGKQYKQDTQRKMTGGKYSKSTRDLESMMTNIELPGIDDSKPSRSWQRSSSLKSTKSVDGASTPRGTSNSSSSDDKPKTKKVKKRRKSFSLGM